MEGKHVRGQSLVEFALSLAILALVFVGVFDLGRAFHAYIIITNAAREGASYGTMHPTDTTGIRNRVLSEAQGSGITLTSADVTISSTGAAGSPMRVTVKHDFSFITSMLTGGNPIRLQSSAEMAIY